MDWTIQWIYKTYLSETQVILEAIMESHGLKGEAVIDEANNQSLLAADSN